MPTPVEIGVFPIAHTTVDRIAVERWLKFVGVSDDYELPPTDAVTDPALLVALAAKRCYKSFEVGLNPNVTRIRSDYTEYLDNVLKSGHGSVLEHSVYTFAFENVSRVFTAEMNRHRAGWAISEGSLRFIRYGENIPYWVADSISGPDVLTPAAIACFRNLDDGAVESSTEFSDDPELALAAKRHATRVVFDAAFGHQERAYRLLERIWADELKPDSTFKQKKELTSLFRRIVGMGVATGGVWTGNIRALRHVIALRTSPAAEEEILHVFSRVCRIMTKNEPMMFGDFTQTPDGFYVPKYPKV